MGLAQKKFKRRSNKVKSTIRSFMHLTQSEIQANPLESFFLRSNLLLGIETVLTKTASCNFID